MGGVFGSAFGFDGFSFEVGFGGGVDGVEPGAWIVGLGFNLGLDGKERLSGERKGDLSIVESFLVACAVVDSDGINLHGIFKSKNELKSVFTLT